MKLSTQKIQQHFDGFLQTPCLWNLNHIYNLIQFEIKLKSVAVNLEIDTKLRLGKYVERFVSYQLNQEKNIQILAENIQIQQEKRTLGELDFIILKNKNPIHLEVIYKFYLYDASVGETEIEHFIGPNRKDSLVEKLNKLKQHQLPLLYTNECENYIKTLNLDILKIEQHVYFKAQIFVPFSNQHIQFKKINSDCIAGYYITKEALNQFEDYKFYIPTKKDWLIIPHTNVKWLDFHQFQLKSDEYLERQFSPMIWIKSPSGTINKAFLVWWEL